MTGDIPRVGDVAGGTGTLETGSDRDVSGVVATSTDVTVRDGRFSLVTVLEPDEISGYTEHGCCESLSGVGEV